MACKNGIEVFPLTLRHCIGVALGPKGLAPSVLHLMRYTRRRDIDSLESGERDPVILLFLDSTFCSMILHDRVDTKGRVAPGMNWDDP